MDHAIDQHSDTKRQHLPDAAAVYCLEGKLWHAHKDVNKAIDCWIEALKLNPFMWDAFMGLCDTGNTQAMLFADNTDSFSRT